MKTGTIGEDRDSFGVSLCEDRLLLAGPPPGSVFRDRRSVLHSELLHAPVHEFRDVQRVRIAAINLIDHAELLELMSGVAEAAERRAVQLQFIDPPLEEGIPRRTLS